MKIDWPTFDTMLRKTPMPRHDVVVGVSRGGLVPATILSHMWGVELEVLHIRSYEGQTQKKPVWSRFDLDMTGKSVLVVDDICDTGETLKLALQLLPPGTRTFTFVRKLESLVRPDYCSIEGANIGWVTFPWESDQAC